MAEIRPYKESYFAHRKKIFFIIALILIAGAAVLSVLYFRSDASQGIYVGKVVQISGSTEDVGLVKTFREGKSISYFSAASGFNDLIFHRFKGDYAIIIVARDADAYLQKKKQENQALAAKLPAKNAAQVSSAQLPPPVNVVSGESGTREAPSNEKKGIGGEVPAAGPLDEPPPKDDDPAPGYARTREAGMREYDREAREMAYKADEIDTLWQKYRDFCQGTIAVTSGNAFGRQWFGIYTTINAADTPECRMMIQDMETLAAEIDAGMEAAWEKAHRAGVYPGQIRAIQQKYRLELDRWNK